MHNVKKEKVETVLRLKISPFLQPHPFSVRD